MEPLLHRLMPNRWWGPRPQTLAFAPPEDLVPTVQVDQFRISSDQSPHFARYVGCDRWAVDFLPGRPLTEAQAIAAMRIAAAPDRPEVSQWAQAIGLTSAEALGLAAGGLPTAGSR